MNETELANLIQGLIRAGQNYLRAHPRNRGGGFFNQAYNAFADLAHSNHEYAAVLATLNPELRREELYTELYTKVLKRVNPFSWGELLEGMMQQIKSCDNELAEFIKHEEEEIRGVADAEMKPYRLQRVLEKAVPDLVATESAVELTEMSATAPAAASRA